ncbi:MAG TPA: ATP-binding protein [Gammaproteobacteria bacterium]|nr:ATP-binding protein [Gammaproteobacteria bacterium]
MERIQATKIIQDLSKKMVLIAGPRQVGKTFLAKTIAKKFSHPVYLNYDQMEDRNIIQKQSWVDATDLIVLDELHKMPHWKNYLKGLYDTKPLQLQILVTGSARLDIFNKMGDSLAGRYFFHRLLPLSPAELRQLNMPIHLDQLIKKSGFPEPYLAYDLIEVNRWRLQYINSVLTTDVFDIDNIQNIRALHTVFELLRTKVGSPVSYQSLAEDIAISPNTVKKYIEILEALFIVFRITPFSKHIARSLLKEPKIYFFDSGVVKGDEGAQLENLVAVCLLKHVYSKIDYFAENYALHYLKTKENHEVDFALVKDDCIEQIIEVKNSHSNINPSLYYFHKKYNLPAIQVVNNIRNEYKVNHIHIMKALNFLSGLFI